MSKMDKLHVFIGLFATIGFLFVAGWAQWGSTNASSVPSDYTEVIAATKWACTLLALAALYLTRLVVPQRA